VTQAAQFVLVSAQFPVPVPEQRLHVLGHFCVINVEYCALLQSPAFAAQFCATSTQVPGANVVEIEPLAGHKLQVFWQFVLIYELKVISLQS
jgi:hypothetical protein